MLAKWRYSGRRNSGQRNSIKGAIQRRQSLRRQEFDRVQSKTGSVGGIQTDESRSVIFIVTRTPDRSQSRRPELHLELLNEEADILVVGWPFRMIFAEKTATPRGLWYLFLRTRSCWSRHEATNFHPVSFFDIVPLGCQTGVDLRSETCSFSSPRADSGITILPRS